jgi:hypothetical protein
LLVLTALLVLSWLARAPLAAHFAEQALAKRGLGAANVEIFSLSPRHAALALRGSALGEIARLELDYQLTRATGVQIKRVRISGARLQLAWRDGQWWPLVESSSGGDTAPLPALAVELDDVRVTLRVGGELLHLRVDGVASNSPAPLAQLGFALGARHGQIEGTLKVQPELDGSFKAQLGLAEGQLTLGAYSVERLRGELAARSGRHGLEHLAGGFSAAEVRSKEQRWGAVTLAVSRAAADAVQVALRADALQSNLRLDGLSSGAPRALSFDAKLDARMLANLLPDVDSAVGQIKLQVHTQVPDTLNSLDAWLQRAQLQASLALKAEHIRLHDGTHLSAVAAAVNCASVSGTLTCNSAEGLKAVTMTPLAPGATDPTSTGSTALALHARDGAPLLTLSSDATATTLAFAAELTSHNAELALRAPLSARVTLATPSVTAASRGGHFEIQGSVDSERPPGVAWLAPVFQVKGDVRLDLDTNTLTALDINDGELAFATQAWTASALRARYASGATPALTASIGQLRNTQTPPLVAPLTARFEARMAGGQTRFDAALRDFAGQLEASLKGQHQSTVGAGEVQLTLKPIKFASAEQVRALLPALGADLHDAHGELSASGGAQWNKSGQHSQLSLGLHELAFSTRTLKVEQLNAALALDKLAPLHSAAGQTISARLELPTLKQVPVTLRFQVADRHVRLEYARADLFDGAFEIHDGDIDITSGATRLDVEVVNVDLASAFTVLNLEQLKGSGRLAGRLPLRFENRHIAVDNGELAANGPGVVQLGANAVTDQLKGHGADVELAFRALSDFHYRSLAIRADKPLLGAGKALFHLEGESPAVMSGQPFVFNISLETDFDYLAALLLELSGITSSALGWGAGELLKP